MAEDFDFAPARPMPLWEWLLRSLGVRYTIALPCVAVLAFILAIIAIRKFKTPALTAILVAVVPLPLFLGAIAFIDGLAASWAVISMSSVTPKSSELAQGAAMSLVSVLVGAILSLPIYVLATLALSYRALGHNEYDVSRESKEPPIGA